MKSPGAGPAWHCLCFGEGHELDFCHGGFNRERRVENTRGLPNLADRVAGCNGVGEGRAGGLGAAGFPGWAGMDGEAGWIGGRHEWQPYSFDDPGFCGSSRAGFWRGDGCQHEVPELPGSPRALIREMSDFIQKSGCQNNVNGYHRLVFYHFRFLIMNSSTFSRNPSASTGEGITGLSAQAFARLADRSRQSWIRVVLLMAVVMCAVSVAQAQLYWDTINGNGLQGGAGTWVTGGTTGWNTSAAGQPQNHTGWTNGNTADFRTGAVDGLNAVTLSGSISALSISQSVTGTQTTISGGTLLTISGSGGLSNSSNLALTINSQSALTANQTWNSASGGGNIIINGAMDNNSSTLAVNGTGTTTINGAMTEAGTITTQAGGVFGGSGSVALISSANLDVNGTLQVGVVGDTSAADFGIVLNGGTMDFGTNTTMDLFGGYNSVNEQSDLVSFAGSSGGTINITGALNLNLLNQPAINSTNWVNGATWQLFNWNGIVPTGDFTSVTGLTDLSSLSLVWDTSLLATAGTISIIPEPSKTGLIGVALLASIFRRRRPQVARA
jgi:hypothetical protein